MAVNEVVLTKQVILFCDYFSLYDEEIQEENISVEREEIARSLKKIYFINDENEEIEITKRLTTEQKEMIVSMENQNTGR